MKKIEVLILSLVVLCSCSSDGGGTPKEVANTAPTVPGLTFPTNNLVCINNSVNFQWTPAKDAENDAIRYEIQTATDNAFTQNLITNIVSSTSQSITLIKGKLYYCRVRAIDSKNVSSAYSSVYNFYTEAESVINHIPFAPVLVSPLLKSIQSTNTVSLNWTATDADATDVLKYDVYLGTTNPPIDKVASGLSINTITINIPTAGTYYWKVVVNDGRGGTTVGQIWSFVK